MSESSKRESKGLRRQEGGREDGRSRREGERSTERKRGENKHTEL